MKTKLQLAQTLADAVRIYMSDQPICGAEDVVYKAIAAFEAAIETCPKNQLEQLQAAIETERENTRQIKLDRDDWKAIADTAEDALAAMTKERDELQRVLKTIISERFP